MKKYLMTGMAAIAFCAAFTSCSKNEDLYDPEKITQNEAAQIQENYNKAFIATFGQPAANHDWGFGSNAKTRVADPRGNMWADEGWNVPPVITKEQKDIVRRYFQQNTPLGYNDPGWSDFWIQQVYKGGTKITDGSKTTEQYRIGNGDMTTGGDHMDHLCSKSASGVEDHINDFNNSDNNDWEGRMLMVESSTYSFGYINSNATAIHYDKAALVNWRVIAQWAVDNNLEESVEKSVLNDGWNRSYMGFDWEQALPDDCYIVNIQTTGGWTSPENYKEGVEYYNGFEVVSKTYSTFEFEGKTYRFLSANSNQYAYDENEPTYGGKVNYNNRPSDDIIRELLSLGYLPYSDTLKDWIKLSTGSDGYYSDWIVTLTEAEQEDEPEWDIRIIAEDLNATAQDTPAAKDGFDESDWDFNDVVFDVKFTSETSANVKIVGAGGVLPLYVAGHEAHEALGQSGPDSKGYYKIQNSGNATPFEVKGISKANNGKDIVITVTRVSSTGDPIISELTAPDGKPAAKIGVNPKFKPCAEREDIRKRYPMFMEWVQTNFSGSWYTID